MTEVDIDRKETLRREKHWEMDPKFFSKLEEISKMKDFDAMISLQRTHSMNLIRKRVTLTEFAPRWIEELNEKKTRWWTNLIIVQAIGLICGVIGRILEKRRTSN